jgi:hypothetical protein
VAAAGVNVWAGKDNGGVSPEDLIPDWGDRRLEYQKRTRGRREKANAEAWKAEALIPDELELL